MEMTKKIVDAALFDMVVYNYINTHSGFTLMQTH